MIEHNPFTPAEAQLRNPAYALNVGYSFADHFGIVADPFDETDAYEAQVRDLNPRTARHLVRYELEDSDAEWSESDANLIMNTASQLGILGTEYPFAGENVDTLIIAEGARSATLDRGVFALEALRAGLLHVGSTILVAGSDRHLGDKELSAFADWAPQAQTGLHVADAAAARLNDEYRDVLVETGIDLIPFHVAQSKPDTRAVTAEIIDWQRGAGKVIGSMAMATTALYVPFKTHKNLAVATPREVDMITRGVASRPSIVDARTVDTYLSEIATTLVSAAQNLRANR